MITGTQNNSLSTSRTPLPFPILVSNWRKPSLADVNWLYPVLDWCKLVPRREVPEDDLTSLMSVNVEKAQHQNLNLATRLPYVRIPSRRPKIPCPSPKNLKFFPRAQKSQVPCPGPTYRRNNIIGSGRPSFYHPVTNPLGQVGIFIIVIIIKSSSSFLVCSA